MIFLNIHLIDSISDSVSLADNSSSLTFNVDESVSTFANTVSSSGKIFKTGESTLTLNTTTSGYSVSSSEFDVNGGSLLFQGEYTGNLVVGNGTNAVILSPGNSVGTLDVTGNVSLNSGSWREFYPLRSLDVTGNISLNSGSTLLLEQDSTGIDVLIAGSFTFADDAILELAMGQAISGATYTILESGTDFESTQATAEYWNSLLSPGSAYFWNLSVAGNQVFAQIAPNAVPEPSTWALRILGFAGLMKLRTANYELRKKQKDGIE